MSIISPSVDAVLLIVGYLFSDIYFHHFGEKDLIFTLPKNTLLFTPNMKGLLKGLRYISDMFEVEKEQEMQIGNPTDVKHVAHIGTDGPATNKPSWMNEFNEAQELSSDTLTNNLQNTPLAAGNHESLPPTSKEKKKPRHKKSTENGTGIESPSSKGSEKHSRRQRSSNHSTGSSPDLEPSSNERHHSSYNSGAESPSQDLSDIPKKSRRKKSKVSSGGSDKNGISLPDLTDFEC